MYQDSNGSSRGGHRKSGSLTEQAYSILRARLLSCDLRPGAEVSELALSREFGMSKTPVREALGRLALEGFVVAMPRRGYRVLPISLSYVEELFTVRRALEATAAELAAERMEPAEVERLGALARATYQPEEKQSLERFIAVNRDFHMSVARAAGVPRLAGLVETHLDEAARLLFLSARTRDISPRTIEGHLRIVEALEKRSPDMARDAMAAHNDQSFSDLMKALQEGDPAFLG